MNQNRGINKHILLLDSSEFFMKMELSETDRKTSNPIWGFWKFLSSVWLNFNLMFPYYVFWGVSDIEGDENIMTFCWLFHSWWVGPSEVGHADPCTQKPLPMILKTPQESTKNKLEKTKTQNSNFYQGLRYVTLEGRQRIQENRLCKLMKRIFMGLYFNTGIQIGETKVIKSCKVNTLVNTNHFPQNLKKRYRLLLAIVVHQSGRDSHSGDRLFEWPKLSEKQLNDK